MGKHPFRFGAAGLCVMKAAQGAPGLMPAPGAAENT